MEANRESEVENYAADISSIKDAQNRIKPYIHVTPVICSETLDSLAGRKLYFKCECFQKGGAFKFRGASNAIFSLDENQASKGVVTHSSGNHAAAVSLAAKIRGIPAYIVIPKNAPKCKVENVIRYGGKVIWSEPTMKSREENASRVLQETGAVLVHPYNDPRIISGQGTVSLELLEQVPQIDTLIVPISGGGLISGVTLGAKSINPTIKVLAAEPRGANDAALSKLNGHIVTLPETNTIADGLRASLGDLTWPIVRDLVDDVIIVDDKEIIEAMRLCYEILKVAVEPSGAIGLAAVLSDSFKNNPAWKDCENVGIVLSGGNVDLGVLWESFNKLRSPYEMFYQVIQLQPTIGVYKCIMETNMMLDKDDLVFVGSCKSTKGITHAIVDSNTVMQNGEKLSGCADGFVSIPEVVNQITQSNFLPYALTQWNPPPTLLKKSSAGLYNAWK